MSFSAEQSTIINEDVLTTRAIEKDSIKMNILEMTDKELYELGQKTLADKLGADQVERFIRKCKPGEGNYSVDRHKLLKNQPDIDTIVKQIQERQEARKVEERERAERFAAPQSEIRKMTDIEIFEIGLKVLLDKLGVAGYWRFLQQCQEINRGYPLEHIKNKEDAEKEIELYTACLTFNPKIVEDYIKRGNAYSYIKEFDKALADYSEAIKLKPDYAEAYSNRANTYFKKNDFDNAIADYTKAIKLNIQDAEAYYTRGKLFDEDGKYDKAITDFTEAIKLDPEHADAWGFRATLYSERGEYDKAIEGFSKEIELRPDVPETYYERGEIYIKKEEYDKAITDFTEAIKLTPEFTEAYFQRAMAYFRLDKLESAIQDFDKISELKQDL